MSIERGNVQSAPLNSKEPAEDEYNKVFVVSLLLGITSLFSKHLISGSGLYFKMIYPTYYSNYFMLYVSLIYSGSDLFALLFIIRYSNHTSFFGRIIFGCIISLITLILLPICMNAIFKQNVDLSVQFILILYGLNGISGSIITVSIFGFLNFLPKPYIRIAVSGQAIGGVIICGIRAIFKENEPINHHNHQYKHDKMVYYQHKSIIYFGSGCVVNLLCIILILFMIKYKNKFVERYLKPYYYNKQTISLNHKYIFNVFNKMYKLCIALFFVTFITFFMWPSMLVHINSKNNENVNEHVWMPIILTFVFVFGDFIGREFISKCLPFYSYNHLWKLCFLRIGLYPFIFCLWKSWISNDVLLYLILSLLSMSDGYFRCLCFINLPKRLNPKQQQTGAALLSFSLITGITIGSFSQLLVVS